MKAALLRRIALLEHIAPPAAPVCFRYGPLKPLPADYDGPRHVVVLTSRPTKSPHVEWCEFEERRGEEEPADPSFTVYLDQTEEENEAVESSSEAGV